MIKKRAIESKTIRFNIIMGVLQSINGSLALLQPVLTPAQFALVAIIIGAVHAGGGVWKRYQTSTAIE